MLVVAAALPAAAVGSHSPMSHPGLQSCTQAERLCESYLWIRRRELALSPSDLLTAPERFLTAVLAGLDPCQALAQEPCPAPCPDGAKRIVAANSSQLASKSRLGELCCVLYILSPDFALKNGRLGGPSAYQSQS